MGVTDEVAGRRTSALCPVEPPPAHVAAFADAAPTLRLSVLDCGRSALVSVAGELDIATCRLLQALLDDVLRAKRTPRIARLVIDMHEVGFVDAAGLSPILHARAVLARRGGVLEIRRPSQAALRLLAVLNLLDVLADPVAESVGVAEQGAPTAG